MLLTLGLGLLLVPAFTGCGPAHGNNYTVFIDPKFALEGHTEEVLDGLDAWKAKVPVIFRPVVSACPGVAEHTICVRYSSVNGIEANFGGGGRYVGMTALAYDALKGDLWRGIDGGECWIAEDYGDSRSRTAIVEHEVGHAMGLGHRFGKVIMDPTRDNGTVFSPMPEDVAEWYDVRQGDGVGPIGVGHID